MDNETARMMLFKSVLGYDDEWSKAVKLALNGLDTMIAIDFAVKKLENEIPPFAQYSRNTVINLLKDLKGE